MPEYWKYKGLRKNLSHLADGIPDEKLFNKYSHLKTQKKHPESEPPSANH